MGVDAQGQDTPHRGPPSLVRSIAGRYAGGSEPLEDLVQVGSVGLIKAVDRYEPKRGSSLAALARPAIEGEIRHHLRDRTPLVRVPAACASSMRGCATPRRLAPAGAATPASWPRRSGRPTPRWPRRCSRAGRRPARRSPTSPRPPRPPPRTASRWSRHGPRSPSASARCSRCASREDLSQAAIARRVGSSQASVSRSLAAALEKLQRAMGPVAAARPATYSGPAMDDGPEGTTGRQEAVRSGRFLIRMPQSLHDALAREAEHEGVSLNTLITNALAGAVGWRDGDGARDAGAEDERPAPRRPRRTAC